ncbi:ATP-dependent DNA helicase [Shewanella sp. D64]|uniref:ATP-dependent DNA helicase n=1 Tax=unclassified Shewanella TaxID=196818 RepID=UPI0022BA3483|nr:MULTISPECIES: ATP-dependent DNA helicase [unclassified Shewanella]MEC4724371.1 ATP-dependent DNA helicase [Shewanella sp. D64]MEC4738883.1 ATP-dependent DNA helicase [Shewanella sp. E94]WBJ97680.1 ATP-dependent DNA helicase [Shewanella sp. MTB7]
MTPLTHKLIKTSIEAFGKDGALANHIQGFSARDVQISMATGVCEAIAEQTNLVVEAGTGVGKTFAYLIPALLSGQQIIVSTGSKNLQEQLFYKDLPTLLSILNLTPKVALLKGRNNYLCQDLLEKQLQGCDSLDTKVLDDLLRINQWAGQTNDGDLGGLTSVSENADALQLIASRREVCSGKKCTHYDACFTRKARSKAMDAKIIVVNHHLFFADRILKETGFAELLPDSDVVIFDEAHLLPDIAVTYFGQQISTRSLTDLLNEIINIYRNELRDSSQIALLTSRCITFFNDWHQQLFDRHEQDWRQLMGDKQIAATVWGLVAELKALESLLLGHVGRSEDLDSAVEKLDGFIHKLSLFFLCDNDQAAYTIDYGHRYLVLRIAPINVTRECELLFDSNTAWIFTSATLQINRDLSLFTKGLGIDSAKKMILDSPFDYFHNALFCVPRHLSRVSHQDSAVRDLVRVATQAINAAQGRTFILFTSHRMMNAVASELRSRVQYPLLIQGQAGKLSLLKKFRQLGNGVLLGTGAFWEGVDVRGKLLSCVIIDKLPFVSPDDSLYRARADSISREGKDPFLTLSLPQAVISLNQGVGRLIRDEKDKGVLILCDNRIVNRPYGQEFLNSLPPMARTRDMDKVVTFLEEIK